MKHKQLILPLLTATVVLTACHNGISAAAQIPEAALIAKTTPYNITQNPILAPTILDKADFTDLGASEKGASGSHVLIDKNNIKYQEKITIANNKKESWSGLQDNYSDILSEFIASKLSYMALNSYSEMLVSPEVYFLFDATKPKEIYLASKYVNFGNNNAVSMDFDGIRDAIAKTSNPGFISDKHHVELADSDDSQDPDILILDKVYQFRNNSQIFSATMDRKTLFNTIVFSAIVGDHDINPGNMFFNFDKVNNISLVGRIDYGHAFNDMIKYWGAHASRVNPDITGYPLRGEILDYFNREKLDLVMDKTGKSKLNRYYNISYIRPELIGSLRQISNVNFTDALNIAKQEIKMMASKNNTIQEKLAVAMDDICRRVGVEPGPSYFPSKLDYFINAIFEFINQNQKEALAVANQLEIQFTVSQVLNEQMGVDEAVAKIMNLYRDQSSRYFSGKNPFDAQEWIKLSSRENTFYGNLPEYIHYVAAKENKLSDVTYNTLVSKLTTFDLSDSGQRVLNWKLQVYTSSMFRKHCDAFYAGGHNYDISCKINGKRVTQRKTLVDLPDWPMIDVTPDAHVEVISQIPKNYSGYNELMTELHIDHDTKKGGAKFNFTAEDFTRTLESIRSYGIKVDGHLDNHFASNYKYMVFKFPQAVTSIPLTIHFHDEEGNAVSCNSEIYQVNAGTAAIYRSASANSIDDNRCGDLYRLSKNGSHHDTINIGYWSL